MNHKQTVREEVGGGYLWSPKTEKGGKRSQFYDNMRDASPGDLVLSYADGAVASVGRVSDFAFTAAKPKEFGVTGEYWAATGWRLPVEWSPLASPIRPKSHLAEISHLLPDKYSPINALTGNGNQKAYLAEISEEMFDALLAGVGFDPPAAFGPTRNRSPFDEYVEGVEDRLEQQIWEDADLSATTKATLTQARRGQGQFRSKVFEIEPKCRITGVDDPKLLVASHIKPWRFCATSLERLDGANGLMLTPDADMLFDRGFMTFGENGEIRVSNRIDPSDLQRMGVPFAGNVGPFIDRQLTYLEFHRTEIFVP